MISQNSVESRLESSEEIFPHPLSKFQNQNERSEERKLPVLEIQSFPDHIGFNKF